MTGKKVWEKVRKILIGMLLGAMALQILFGVLWLCTNIGSGQIFSRSLEYAENARELCFDEYSGVLYVLFIRLSLGMEKLLGVPYYIVVSLGQVMVAFLGGSYFFRCLRKDSRKLFEPWDMLGGLYLLTVPMLLQAHLAVRPVSLISMLFLMMLGIGFKDSVKNIKTAVWMAVLWVALGLLDSAYLFLGLLPAGVFCLRLLREKKSEIKNAAVLIVAVITILVVNGAVLQPAENKIQRTFGGAMVSRLAWPWFDQSYYFWPEEVKMLMPEELAHEISAEPEKVIRVFGPLMERAYGREKAGTLYLNMAKSSLDVRTKEVLEGIRTDFKAYLCVPVSLERQLEGKGGYSYSGWNYKVMGEQAPGLTRLYLQSSFLFMQGALWVGMLLLAGKWIKRIKNKEKWFVGTGIYVAFAAVILGQAAWFSMSGAGMMDYMKVSVSTALWYLIPVWILKDLTKSDV